MRPGILLAPVQQEEEALQLEGGPGTNASTP